MLVEVEAVAEDLTAVVTYAQHIPFIDPWLQNVSVLSEAQLIVLVVVVFVV